MYFRGSTIVIACFSLDSQNSFEELQKVWIPKIYSSKVNCPIFMVGLKSDLEREVSLNDAINFAVSKGLLYFEASSKMDFGVSDFFRFCSLCVLKKSRKIKEHHDENSLKKEENGGNNFYNYFCSIF